jgi:hypothetical protein
MYWANKSDYLFTEDLDQAGWTWEFVRRSPEYRADFIAAQTSDTPIFVPPRNPGESERLWMDRVVISGKDPEKLAPAVYFARRWRMRTGMQDPGTDEVPEFENPYPRSPEWDEVGVFFEESGPHSPFQQKKDKATLVFDLCQPLPPQLSAAKLQLGALQKTAGKPSKTNIQKHEWQRYLQLLDAKEAGADNNEIISNIGYYSVLDNSAASGYSASDRLSDNLKRARELLDNPLQILS